MSTNVATTKYDYSISPPLNGSDVHNTLFADVELPGTGSSGGAVGSWAWPLGEAAWKSDGSGWLDGHTTTSDAWTNSIKAADDLNIGAGNDDCGAPVYSMLDGTIINSPTYTLQVQSTLNGKTVLITYAHGKNMKASGTVKAGDKIMEISNNGTSGSCHLHLEIRYGAKPICPQVVFPILGSGQQPNLETLPTATYACAGA